MMRKRASGLVVRGLGLIGPLVGPLGCAIEHARTLDAALFVPPGAASNSPGVPIEPATAAVAGDLQAASQPGVGIAQSPKNASILPGNGAAPGASALENITPIEALPASPATMPAALSPSSSPVTQTDPTASAIQASAVLPPQTDAGAPVENPMAPVAIPAGQGPRSRQNVYMTLGCVVAVVNDTPIYANQVLAPLNKAMIAKARELNPAEFREFAMTEIERQLDEMIDDERYFAVAYHGLTDEDKKIAKAIAMEVRQDRITAAGGSEEEARKKTLDEEGIDFDQSLEQEYRRIVHYRYQARRIDPLVQVTAEAMREYYRLNVDKLYSDKDKAQFRVLEIDPAQAGGMKAAMEKISALRDRAAQGEDFGKIASVDNDNAYLKGNAGLPKDPGEWLMRGDYPIDAVEAALWQIEPGQITPVVESKGVLYIAKLEAKHAGTVKPFDDRSVQDDIYKHIHDVQMNEGWQRAKHDPLNDSMVVTDTGRLQIALDMAMQTYAQVAGQVAAAGH